MKQIIENVLYDTDNATEIYFDEEKKRHWYRTNNGNYFIAFPNGEITVVSEQVAKDFLGKRDIDKYISIWGVPREG